MWNSPFFLLVAGFYVAFLLFATVHILLYRKDSHSAALWLLMVLFLPVLGLLFYALLSADRVERRALVKQASNRKLRQEYEPFFGHSPYIETLSNEAHKLELLSARSSSPTAHEFPQVIDALCSRPLLNGNRIRPFYEGDEVYFSMLQTIEQARSSINLMTFIFGADKVGLQLIEALIQKAEEGVAVRFLYDSVGSIKTLWFLDELRHAKIRAQAFSPLNPLKRRWQINLRNHRKLLIVDGRLAFTGGMNITEKHLIDHPLFQRVKDYHFLVKGPVVRQLQESFVEDWYYATSEKLLSDEYFPAQRVEGTDQVRVITSGPDGDYEAFYQVIFAAIVGARSRIIIVTPYFIADRGLLTAVRIACSKGVEITLLVPGHSDHPFMTLAARTFYEELLRNDVRIYERRAPFLHAKVLIVDDDWVTIGSANMDIRSFRLNFETNLEVRSPSLVKSLVQMIQQEIQHSNQVELNSFRRRSISARVLEGACGLFSSYL